MDSPTGWRIVKRGPNGSFVTFRYYAGAYQPDGEGQDAREIAEYEAFCRWDGCIQLQRFFNGDDSGAEEDTDSIHICELPAFTRVLQDLQRVASQHFRDTEGHYAWPYGEDE